MNQIICEVFKSDKRQDLYLYTDKQKGLAVVPQELLSQLGSLTSAMTFLLSPKRKLAQLDPVSVLKKLDTEGFYLQVLPLDDDPERMAMSRKNIKLWL